MSKLVEQFGELDRREALQVMGASAALALGIPGCKRKPTRKIVSRAMGPEYQEPGKALYYASTWTEGAFPYGIVVKTVDGRPIKIEGNPDHPINRGGSSAQMQASILSLYDPDRLKKPIIGGKEANWRQADEGVIKALRSAKSTALLTRSNLGPSERELIKKFQQVCPGTKHFVYESIHNGQQRKAWQKIFGQDGELIPRFSQAKVILSLDCDFLGTDGTILESIREFAASRKVSEENPKQTAMSRLYVAESAMTVTGSNADHRLRIPPGAISELVEILWAALLGTGEIPDSFAQAYNLEKPILQSLLEDLKSHRGQALVVAGSHLPESVHIAVCQLNAELGALGKTLEWNPEPATLAVDDPKEIAAAFESGVDVLICMGVNPMYDWPGGGFETLLKKAKVSIGHGLYMDETISACYYMLPSHHNLESWNDAQPRSGTYSLCQPVIAPLFDTRQEAESLLTWAKGLAPDDAELQTCKDWHDFVKQRWQNQLLTNEENKERAWEIVLQRGVLETRVTTSIPRIQDVAIGTTKEQVQQGYELILQPHHAVYDGRFANNGWLQEQPEPVSKLVWDNAATISANSAKKLGVSQGDGIQIKANGKTIELPVLVQPGTADGVIITTLGQGRTKAGSVGTEVGVNTFVLISLEDNSQRVLRSVKVNKTNKKYKLVRAQEHFSLENRPIALDATLTELYKDAKIIQHKKPHMKKADIYEGHDYSQGHKWALAVDLNACVGCGACVVACQAENNIPVVGKTECGRGREMHWLRVDRYHAGDPDNPTVFHQLMMCQQCDNAPCENVCPVNATVHGSEGLNEMVYNRCVGTRYCANNCPYKVRRFNFFDYTKQNISDPVRELAYNPQVTVRMRGVMEKCTFCLQRINSVKFKAKNKKEKIKDGTIQTACQQACPAGAIVFGNMNDPDSRIGQMAKSGRAYLVLEELNVKPNVHYLAKIRNPHPTGGMATRSLAMRPARKHA